MEPLMSLPHISSTSPSPVPRPPRRTCSWESPSPLHSFLPTHLGSLHTQDGQEPLLSASTTPPSL